MSIKLIAIDMDGTLLNEHSELNPATIKTIQQATATGIKIVICTGRPLPGVSPFLKQLDLAGDDQYVITFNGAIAQTIDGRIITRHTLTFNDYIDIETMSRKIDVHCHVESEDHIYTANRDLSPYTIQESQLVNMHIRYREPGSMRRDLPIAKCMYIDDPAVLRDAQPKLPKSFTDRFYTVNSEPYFFEILNKDASKGRTLQDLSERLNFSADEVMAIGDQANDLSMLRFAGTPVAMGNGIPAVKETAKFVTKTNREDGVAYAIHKFALD